MKVNKSRISIDILKNKSWLDFSGKRVWKSPDKPHRAAGRSCYSSVSACILFPAAAHELTLTLSGVCEGKLLKMQMYE